MRSYSVIPCEPRMQAFEIQQFVSHMQTHNLVAHAGIVAHGMCAIHGDNRPCHHTVVNTCGEHTAMIGTQRALIISE